MILRIFLGVFISSALAACQNDGFKPPRTESTNFVLTEVEVDTDKADADTLAQSPRVLAVSEAAKESSLKMEMDALSTRDVKIIMSAEVEKTPSAAAKDKYQYQVRAIVASFGMIAEYKADILTSGDQDGKANVAAQFVADEVLVPATTGVPGDAGRTFQVISHCSNSCEDLFVHIQINNKDKFEAGAFYNFKRDEAGEYKILNSSLGESYKNLAATRAVLKANPN